jgi:hypothetical protein
MLFFSVDSFATFLRIKMCYDEYSCVESSVFVLVRAAILHFLSMTCKRLSFILASSQYKSSPAVGSAASRNLWISGLSSTTRAADLKGLFSKHGKVIH